MTQMKTKDDRGRLKEALRHEENAVKLYRKYASETDSESLSEMFEQFAKNESWHAAALREKLENSQR